MNYHINMSDAEYAATTCTGKTPFDSFDIALEVTRRKGHHKKSRQVYKCKICHKFHIGGIQRKRGFRIRRIHELGK